jgi:hypothetical protein
MEDAVENSAPVPAFRRLWVPVQYPKYTNKFFVVFFSLGSNLDKDISHSSTQFLTYSE